MNKKSWVILLIAGPVLLVISFISLRVVDLLSREFRYEKVLERFESTKPPDMQAYTTYQTRFETYGRRDRKGISFLTYMPDTEDVFLVTMVMRDEKFDGVPKDINRDNWSEYVKGVSCVASKQGFKSFWFSEFHLIRDVQILPQYTLSEIWMAKVPSELKELAIPMRLKPLKKKEPVWFFGTKRAQKAAFMLGVVRKAKKDRIEMILARRTNGFFDSATPIVDKEGKVVGFGLGARSSDGYLGISNPISFIHERNLSADLESIKESKVNF